ncbi:hypothetical protein B0H11DRAFT_2199725 [Mycena galericulata]|nr:hypothetical protein B0H11DRAFT_2199725 [Mycena galericulata]
MSLTESPPDILLEITSHLDLQESLQLVATCSACKALTLFPSFWITALNRMEQFHRRPLPCSPGTEITSLSLAKLQELATYAYRLMKNWASKVPRPSSIRKISIEYDTLRGEFHPIQGSRLYLTLLPDRLECWDMTSGNMIGAIGSPEGYTRSSAISTFSAPGKCNIGKGYLTERASDTILELVVSQINHRYPYAVTFSKVASRNWIIPDTSPSMWNVDLTDKMIAVLLSVNNKDMLLLYDFASPDQFIRRATLSRSIDSLRYVPRAIVIHGDNIYTTRNFEKSVEILHVRSPLMASEVQINTVKRTLPFLVDEIEETDRDTLNGVGRLPPRPTYGIFHVTQRWPNYLHFWPAEDVGSHFEFGPLRLYEHPGRIDSFAISSSRTLVVIRDRHNAFGIVQYIFQPTPHIAFRPL